MDELIVLRHYFHQLKYSLFAINSDAGRSIVSTLAHSATRARSTLVVVAKLALSKHTLFANAVGDEDLQHMVSDLIHFVHTLDMRAYDSFLILEDAHRSIDFNPAQISTRRTHNQ